MFAGVISRRESAIPTILTTSMSSPRASPSSTRAGNRANDTVQEVRHEVPCATQPARTWAAGARLQVVPRRVAGSETDFFVAATTLRDEPEAAGIPLTPTSSSP